MIRLGEDEYDMYETPNGGFVKYEDYKKLERKFKFLLRDSEFENEDNLNRFLNGK